MTIGTMRWKTLESILINCSAAVTVVVFVVSEKQIW
jgi:hypothetical protein